MAASGVAAGLLSSCLLRPGLGMHELTISNTELGHLFDGMQQKEAAFSQIALAPTLLGGLGSGGGSGDSSTALASGYGQTQRMAFHATSNVSMVGSSDPLLPLNSRVVVNSPVVGSSFWSPPSLVVGSSFRSPFVTNGFLFSLFQILWSVYIPLFFFFCLL